MDATRLQLSIPLYRLSPDGSNTYYYDIQVAYGKLKWVVSHRFKNFILLANNLQNEGYDAIPTTPPKTLTRPHDPSFLEGRCLLLQNWMYSICHRPDLRNSASFLDFINFELHTNTDRTSTLLPQFMGCTRNYRFRVSDCIYIPSVKSQGSLLVAHEENAHISRLGKVWSVIDQDELGSIDLFSINSTPALDEKQISETVLKLESRLSSIVPFRVHAVFFHSPSGKIFCGTDTGILKIYFVVQQQEEQTKSTSTFKLPTTRQDDNLSFQGPGTEHRSSLSLLQISEIILHQDSINCLRGDLPSSEESSNSISRLLSVGADNAVRIIDCNTFKTICGGKIVRRLKPGEHLNVAVLEPPCSNSSAGKMCQMSRTAQDDICKQNIITDQPLQKNQTDSCQNDGVENMSNRLLPNSRFFVGTNFGHVFIYNCGIHPPKFLAEIEVEGHVRALELAGSTLLIAHDCNLSLVKISKDCSSGVAHLERTLNIFHFTGKPGFIQSIAISQTSPFLFLGHSRSVSIWDCITYQCMSVFKAHTKSVRKLHFFHSENYQNILITGSSDGYVKFWSIKPYEQFQFWSSPQQDKLSVSYSGCKESITNHKISCLDNENTHDLVDEDDDGDDDEPLLGSVMSAAPHRH